MKLTHELWVPREHYPAAKKTLRRADTRSEVTAFEVVGGQPVDRHYRGFTRFHALWSCQTSPETRLL
jgi:hypothetical protein